MYKTRNASGAKGQIQGRLTDSHFINPLQGITVIVSVQDTYNISLIKEVETDENGNYIITGLPPDTYYIRFKDKSGRYLNKEYSSKPAQKTVKKIIPVKDPFKHIRYIANLNEREHREEFRKRTQQYADSMEKVVVTAGNTTKLLDTFLSLSGGIKGRVTGNDGVTPLKDIEVELYSRNNDYWYDFYHCFYNDYAKHHLWRTVYRKVNTDADGYYFINGLESGAYRIRFHDKSGYYADDYYNNKISPHLADDIDVISELNVIGIDASLPVAAHIKGGITAIDGITPLKNLKVTLTVHIDYGDGIKGFNSVSANTDSNGDYDIGGLSAGTYKNIEVHDESGRYMKTLAEKIDINFGEIIRNIDGCLERKIKNTSGQFKTRIAI